MNLEDTLIPHCNVCNSAGYLTDSILPSTVHTSPFLFSNSDSVLHGIQDAAAWSVDVIRIRPLSKPGSCHDQEDIDVSITPLLTTLL